MVEILHAGVPLLGLAALVAVQLLLIRARRGGDLLRSLAEGCAAGLLVVLAAEAWLFPLVPGGRADRIALAAVNVATCGLLGACYFNFVNLGVTARRPRILIELREAPQGLTYGQLLERYDAASMVTARLGRLLASGQVVERDGRYRIGKPVMLALARGIVLAKRVVMGKASEFDD
jgi:hypothetical protein